MSSALLCFTCAITIFSFVCVDCGLFPSEPYKFNQSEPENKRQEFLAKNELNYTQAIPSIDLLHINKTNNDLILINRTNMLPSSISSSALNTDQVGLVPKATSVNKNLSEFALEGGGIVMTQNYSKKIQEDLITLDDELHSKKSKGRKGVTFPGSSVVPRKGAPVTVDHIEELQSNNTPSSESQPIKNNFTKPVQSMKSNLTAPIVNETIIGRPLFNGQLLDKTNVLNSSHSKKPEYVSDEKDFFDFDKYTIIKTSTTGTDYVIIGIVIVIGIWFSVFGALIFYRRAGEYWDRRHYRRMDFLVDGMYND